MAQAVRHEKALLIQKDAKGQMPGAYIPAGKLTYADPKCWIINDDCAVLIGSFVLHVDGKYQTEKFKKLPYKVSFEVQLTDNCNIDEVELKLTLPDGSVQTRIESLKNYARNVPISLNAGEFSGGDIKFELQGTERKTLKTGLDIFGVNIKPGPFNAADA